MRFVKLSLIVLFSMLYCDRCSATQYLELQAQKPRLGDGLGLAREDAAKNCRTLVECVTERGTEFLVSTDQRLQLTTLGIMYPQPDIRSLDMSWRIWLSVNNAPPSEITQFMDRQLFGEPMICKIVYARIGNPVTLTDGRTATILRIGCAISGSGRGFIASDVVIVSRGSSTNVLPLEILAERTLAFGLGSFESRDSEVRYGLIDRKDSFIYRIKTSEVSDNVTAKQTLAFASYSVSDVPSNKPRRSLQLSKEFANARSVLRSGSAK